MGTGEDLSSAQMQLAGHGPLAGSVHRHLFRIHRHPHAACVAGFEAVLRLFDPTLPATWGRSRRPG